MGGVAGTTEAAVRNRRLLLIVGAVLAAIVFVVIVAMLAQDGESSPAGTASTSTPTTYRPAPARYATCGDAARDGRWNIPRGDPAYDERLDGDGDGIACERH